MLNAQVASRNRLKYGFLLRAETDTQSVSCPPLRSHPSLKKESAMEPTRQLTVRAEPTIPLTLTISSGRGEAMKIGRPTSQRHRTCRRRSDCTGVRRIPRRVRRGRLDRPVGTLAVIPIRSVR